MPPVKKVPHKRRKHFLREWRDYRELSQEEAAARAHVSRTTLSKIESGQVPYNQDLLERLAFAYGIEVDDLLTVDPRFWDEPRLVYDAVKRAPPDMQSRALEIVRALLKKSA